MSVACVELVPGTLVPVEQRLRFIEEPGLGAVVLGGGGAVLVHERLLGWCPWSPGLDPKRWLTELTQRLTDKGYRVEDPEGREVSFPPPPLSLPARAKGVLRRAIKVPLRVRVQSGRRRWRRRAFMTRVRWEAWLAGTQLQLDVAPDLRIEPGVRLEMRPGPARLSIGPRCTIASGVLIRLGGELLIGTNCEIRHDAVLNIKGRTEFQGRNGFGVGVMVHADQPLVFEWGSAMAEYATVLDSDHEFDGTLLYVLDRAVHAAPVRIGACSFIGSKSSVMPGVTLGRRAVVGAGSVVTRDVPDGWIVTGLPAKPVRELPRLSVFPDGAEESSA